MIAALGTFSLLARVGMAAGLVVVFLGSVALYNESKRKEGEARAVAKIEKANTNAVKKGTRAAERSRDPSVRGPIDPTTRD
jgi:hypothetical protein